MTTFKQFLEGVADIASIKRKKLVDRTPREAAALAAASKKAPTGKVVVHLEYEDGSIVKDTFKLKRNSDKWENEADEIADGHLKHMQNMYDRFKQGSRPVKVVKRDIK